VARLHGSMPFLNEFSHRQRKQSSELDTNHFLVSLPNDTEIDKPKANDCQDEWEHHAVLEDAVGQMPKVTRCTKAAENRENPARKYGAYRNHYEVDTQIDKFVKFTVRMHH